MIALWKCSLNVFVCGAICSLQFVELARDLTNSFLKITKEEKAWAYRLCERYWRSKCQLTKQGESCRQTRTKPEEPPSPHPSLHSKTGATKLHSPTKSEENAIPGSSEDCRAIFGSCTSPLPERPCRYSSLTFKSYQSASLIWHWPKIHHKTVDGGFLVS